jgi:hypothetical protein
MFVTLLGGVFGLTLGIVATADAVETQASPLQHDRAGLILRSEYSESNQSEIDHQTTLQSLTQFNGSQLSSEITEVLNAAGQVVQINERNSSTGRLIKNTSFNSNGQLLAVYEYSPESGKLSVQESYINGKLIQKNTYDTQIYGRFKTVEKFNDKGVLYQKNLFDDLGILASVQKHDPVTGLLLKITEYDAFGNELREINPFVSYFETAAHPATGLPLSHPGSDDPLDLSYSFDLALYIMLDGETKDLVKEHLIQDSPFVVNADYNPAGGIYSVLSQTGEWQEGYNRWNIDAGSNAWLGLALLDDYVETGDSDALAFAESRGDFLDMLWDDVAGGIRMGPEGQFGPFAGIKSTENNISAYHFFTALHEASGNIAYLNRADALWDYIKSMYDPLSHTFIRGERYLEGLWVKDSVGNFATDTVSWLPLDRILQDEDFGITILDRLLEVEAIVKAAENLTGFSDADGVIQGFSFSPLSRADGVMTIEWSSQFALFYLKIAEAYRQLNLAAQYGYYQSKYMTLMEAISRHFDDLGTSVVSPYAVYFDTGGGAYGVDTGHDFNTPFCTDDCLDVYSTASAYYWFAKNQVDPLQLGVRSIQDTSYIE